jgi:hypothetical protein
MIHVADRAGTAPAETIPSELVELREKVRAQPSDVRAELEPLVDEVLEHARFRHRVMAVARGALEQFKLDLELTRFDLDATRREREALLRLLDGR